MKEDKDIFLPDTTVKLETLKKKLLELYGLVIIPKEELKKLKYKKGGLIENWKYEIGGL